MKLEKILIKKNEFNNYHIKINNYIGTKLVKYGWGVTFGRGGVTCFI